MQKHEPVVERTNKSKGVGLLGLLDTREQGNNWVQVHMEESGFNISDWKTL